MYANANIHRVKSDLKLTIGQKRGLAISRDRAYKQESIFNRSQVKDFEHISIWHSMTKIIRRYFVDPFTIVTIISMVTSEKYITFAQP